MPEQFDNKHENRKTENDLASQAKNKGSKNKASQEFEVKNYHEAMDLIWSALDHRKVADNGVNRHSSRRHLLIEQIRYDKNSADQPLNSCYFIDMCGYEVGHEKECTDIKLDSFEAGQLLRSN